MLFREPGITVASILTAIGMAIAVMVKTLLPSSEGATSQGKGGVGKPENVKEWLRNKLETLVRLLGKLRVKQQKHCQASLGQSSAGFSIGQKK